MQVLLISILIFTAIHNHVSITNNVATGLARQDVMCKTYNRNFSIKY